jgi:hypothetical protein
MSLKEMHSLIWLIMRYGCMDLFALAQIKTIGNGSISKSSLKENCVGRGAVTPLTFIQRFF